MTAQVLELNNNIYYNLNNNLINLDTYRIMREHTKTIYVNKIHEELINSEKNFKKYNELINFIFQEYERYIPNVVLNEGNADIITTKDNLNAEELFVKNSVLLMQKRQINFLLISTSTIIISLIGIMVFILSGLYFIHPAFYILLFLMGMGWEATAVYLIKSGYNEGC